MTYNAMNKIIIASLALFLFVPAQAFGLGYLGSNHDLKLELGESGTIDFFLHNPTTGSTLQAEVTGPGAQYYKYDSEMIATDGQNKFTFTVTIPEDYDGAAKLKNAIKVTQLADKDPSKPITVQEAVRVFSTITIDDDYIQSKPVEKLTPKPTDEPPESEEPTNETTKEPIETVKVADTVDKVTEPEEITEKEVSNQVTASLTILDPESVACGPGTEMIDGMCQVIKTEKPRGGGCLIATAVYGTELAPQVQYLREIRDNTLMSTSSGESFMGGFNIIYYSFAPTVSDIQREHQIINDFVRLVITPGLYTLNIMSFAETDSESSVLMFGMLSILGLVGIYVVSPALIACKLQKIKVR